MSLKKWPHVHDLDELLEEGVEELRVFAAEARHLEPAQRLEQLFLQYWHRPGLLAGLRKCTFPKLLLRQVA